MASARCTNEIVVSLFPESVRQQMYNQVNTFDASPESLHHIHVKALQRDLQGEKSDGNVFGSEPLADLFPHAIVTFFDIAGFHSMELRARAKSGIHVAGKSVSCF
jgi:hypothetical protein